MRIYLGNIEVAGYFSRLKKGFERIGVNADLWCLIDNPYYNTTPNKLLRANQRCFAFYKKYKKSTLAPLALLAAMAMAVIHSAVFLYSLARYDVFILNSQPFFNYSELYILKLFRKKVIVVFLGTDSRPAYLSGDLIHSRFRIKNAPDTSLCYRHVRSQVNRIRRIEKYADHLINHPPSAMLHHREFIAWLHIGFPHEKPPASHSEKDPASRIVNVLHAPSNNFSKGSERISAMVLRLQENGFPVRLLKVQNVPNETVLREIENCDLVLDEVFSDIPIGGLGTEAAFAGKSVINSGYYTMDINSDYPSDVIPPSCYCIPDNLEYELKQYILDKDKRESSGKRLYDFVAQNWECQTIAEKYIRIIHDDIPAHWLYHPSRISHFAGYGIDTTRLKSFLKAYLNDCGSGGLFLDDKPELKSKIEQFANSGDLNL